MKKAPLRLQRGRTERSSVFKLAGLRRDTKIVSMGSKEKEERSWADPSNSALCRRWPPCSFRSAAAPGSVPVL